MTSVSDVAQTHSSLKLLVDTNVWLDYFLARGERHRSVMQLVERAYASEDVVLFAASPSLKDISYLLTSSMKSGVRQNGGEVTPDVVAAARETAWACVRKVLELAYVAPVDQTDITQAFAYKCVHADFEDDVLLSVAHRIGADYIVTHDDGLLRHVPNLCMGVDAALEKLRR